MPLPPSFHFVAIFWWLRTDSWLPLSHKRGLMASTSAASPTLSKTLFQDREAQKGIQRYKAVGKPSPYTVSKGWLHTEVKDTLVSMQANQQLDSVWRTKEAGGWMPTPRNVPRELSHGIAWWVLLWCLLRTQSMWHTCPSPPGLTLTLHLWLPSWPLCHYLLDLYFPPTSLLF